MTEELISLLRDLEGGVWADLPSLGAKEKFTRSSAMLRGIGDCMRRLVWYYTLQPQFQTFDVFQEATLLAVREKAEELKRAHERCSGCVDRYFHTALGVAITRHN